MHIRREKERHALQLIERKYRSKMIEQKDGQAISEAEAQLYDRQIRLWGLDAQKRLRASRILLIGLSGLGAEVAKNLVLAGIKSIVLLDHRNVKVEDSCSQFLVHREDIGKNRAECSQARTQLLNPLVEVTADSSRVEDKPDDYFAKFDVICALCCPPKQLIRLNNLASSKNIRFYCGDVWGFYGFMFADLIEHEYAEEVKVLPKKDEESDEPVAKKGKQDTAETTVVKNTIKFVRLQEALDVDWSEPNMTKRLKRTPSTYFITQALLTFRAENDRDPNTEHSESDKEKLLKVRDDVIKKLGINQETLSTEFLRHCMAELSPVCAVVGGVLAQEVIKAVSQKDPPLKNFFFYNGIEGSGMVDFISK